MAVPIPGVLPGPREHEALVLVADGLTNEQIAKRMHICRSTAACYIENLKVRFGATSRANLVHRAHLRGMLADSGTANAHDSYQAGWAAGLLEAARTMEKTLAELAGRVTDGVGLGETSGAGGQS